MLMHGTAGGSMKSVAGCDLIGVRIALACPLHWRYFYTAQCCLGTMDASVVWRGPLIGGVGCSESTNIIR